MSPGKLSPVIRRGLFLTGDQSHDGGKGGAVKNSTPEGCFYCAAQLNFVSSRHGGMGGRNAECGRRKAEGGMRKAECGRRKAEGGRRKAEGGRRKAEGGRRKAEGEMRNAEGGRRNAKCEMRNAEGGRLLFFGGNLSFFCRFGCFFAKDTAFFVKTTVKLQKNHKKIHFLLIRGVDKSQTAAYNIRGTLCKNVDFTHKTGQFYNRIMTQQDKQ